MFPCGYSWLIGDLSNASSQYWRDTALACSADHVSRFHPGTNQPEPQFNFCKLNHHRCVTFITQSSTGLTQGCTQLGKIEVNRVSCCVMKYHTGQKTLFPSDKIWKLLQKINRLPFYFWPQEIVKDTIRTKEYNIFWFFFPGYNLILCYASVCGK